MTPINWDTQNKEFIEYLNMQKLSRPTVCFLHESQHPGKAVLTLSKAFCPWQMPFEDFPSNGHLVTLEVRESEALVLLEISQGLDGRVETRE